MDSSEAPIEVPIGRTAQGRRHFPIAYRVEFLQRWDQATTTRGARARSLRANHLSEATVQRWIRAREAGEFTASMTAAASNPRIRMDSQHRAELAELRAENAALTRKNNQHDSAGDHGKSIRALARDQRKLRTRRGTTDHSGPDERRAVRPLAHPTQPFLAELVSALIDIGIVSTGTAPTPVAEWV